MPTTDCTLNELTPTEYQVLSYVAQGWGNKRIAEERGVSLRTIESHVANMFQKTGLKNRTELAVWAMQQ